MLILGGIVLILLVLPVPFLEKLRVVSAGVCAQRVGHSILFGGVQPPLEARMIGIYGGFMVAALGFALFGRAKSVIMAPVPILAISLLFVAVMGFDGMNALFYDIGLPHAYAPQNWLRLVTGTICGIGVATLLVPVVNFSLWRNGDLRPVVDLRRWFGVLGLGALFIAIVMTGAGFLLYPVSILSVGGVIALVLAINLIFTLAITRREGTAERLKELAGPLAIAVPLAIGELVLLAMIRFWAESTLGITPL